ncbi:MAG: prepilin peptidase [Candidatus Fimimonas sp.]
MEQFYLVCTYVLAGVLGLCVGSFLNVLIYRLPRGENIAKPGSHCTKCGYSLKWYDNIPVLSYLLLRGKCRKCGEKISPRYTIVEVFNCLVWLACVWRFYNYGIGVVIAFCIALSALTVAFFVDLENTIIPDSMTIGIALCGIATLVLEIFNLGVGVSWQERLIGAALGFGLFAAFYFGYLWIRKKEGLGFGDVKLMGAVGLLLGWKSTLLCVILACIATIVWVVIKTIANRKKQQSDLGEFPFAPFLTASAAFCLFFGESICSFYVSLLMGG